MKIVKAKIKEGKCYILENEGEEQLADDVILMVLGKGDSEGFALLDKDKAIYIAQTQSDLQETIDELIGICEQLIDICGIKPVMTVTGQATGNPATPPEMIAAKPKIENIKSKLEQFKPK